MERILVLASGGGGGGGGSIGGSKVPRTGGGFYDYRGVYNPLFYGTRRKVCRVLDWAACRLPIFDGEPATLACIARRFQYRHIGHRQRTPGACTNGVEWEEAQRATDNGAEGEEDVANATETVGIISSA